MSDEQDRILLYGTQWCFGSARARRLLDKHGVPYRWIDIDRDRKASDYVQEVNKGFRSVPTIVFPDGSILVEPSDAELAQKLGL